MKGKLSVGEVFNEVFAIYGANAAVLLPLAFWLYLIAAILNGVAGDSVGLLLVSLVVSAIVGTLYQGVVVSLVRDVQDGRRDFSMGDLISQAMPFLGPLIGIGILSGIAVAVGFLLLIVPGLYLLTIWAVIAPVIVVERSGVLAAFGRSRQLVRGNGWPVFGAVISAFLLVVIGSMIFGGIAEAIVDGPLLRIVFSALAATITAPIVALVASVLYFRLLALQPPAPAPEQPVAAPPTPGT